MLVFFTDFDSANYICHLHGLETEYLDRLIAKSIEAGYFNVEWNVEHCSKSTFRGEKLSRAGKPFDLRT